MHGCRRVAACCHQTKYSVFKVGARRNRTCQGKLTHSLPTWKLRGSYLVLIFLLLRCAQKGVILVATTEQKIRAYKDAVEITKAAVASGSGYSIAAIPNLFQGIYDKLLETLEKTTEQNS